MFPDILYRYAESRPDKVITRISPSMVGRCHRTHFYAIKGVPQTTPPGPGALLNFKVGFLWEEVVSEALRHAKMPFIEQLYIEDEELNMAGTADFLVQVNGRWEVWDSKTEGWKASTYRARVGKSFFNTHPEYVHQLNAYCILLRRKEFDVVQGRFGVIVKDNGSISESITPFKDASLAKTQERIDEMRGYLERDELPECECEGWQVNYCSYGDPHSIEKNKTGKSVPTRCCSETLMEGE